MLLPQEIRNHEFTHAIRGYTTAEVDEYIDFLAEKFDALNRENDELDRKLTIAMKKLEELQAREASITRLDTEMRRAAAKLLHQAEMQQAKILADAQAKADQIVAEADACATRQKNLCAVMQEEILRFKEDLYERYSHHIDQLEEIAQASSQMSFGTSLPAVAPVPAAVDDAVKEIEEIPEAEETDDTEALEVPESISEIEEIENLETPESVNEIEEIEQMDLFDSVDDTEAIHKELEEMMGTWTDYTDAVEEEIDPGYTLILPEDTSAETEADADADEEIVALDADEIASPDGSDDDGAPTDEDTLLLQNLRRAFSVEFETFDSKKSSSSKAAAKDNEDEFSFVENEPPKKRGFLSRLIGGDSDEA